LSVWEGVDLSWAGVRHDMFGDENDGMGFSIGQGSQWKCGRFRGFGQFLMRGVGGWETRSKFLLLWKSSFMQRILRDSCQRKRGTFRGYMN
jgi:hypothetical protein